MRVVALVLAVGLIVAGGFWLARDRAAATPAAAAGTPAGATAGTAADTPASSPSAAGSSTEAPSAADADGAAPAADTAAGQAAPATDDAPPAAPGDAGGAGGDEGAEGGNEPASPDAATEPGAAPPAEDVTGLPEGYEQVPFTSEEPRRVFDAPGQALEAGLDYAAVLRTNRGDIVVDLYEDRTPLTVNNFVFLALNRYYQGVPFHRVLEDFMAQTGDPTGTGSGGPGYQFADEIVDGLVFDRAGLLAMANAGPGPDGSGTNGSQFFITFAPTPWLNGGHTIFGHVLEGEALLDEIERVDPASPSAIVMPGDTLADLAAQGIELPGESEQTVEAAIAELVGTTPVAGQSFTVAGYRGVLGQVGDGPAYGFFAQPDTLLEVIIGQRPAP